MHLTVKGKQIDVGDALRGYVAENLRGAVAKFFDRPIEATVVFSRVAHLFRADISVHVGRGIMVQSNGEADEAYPAFDDACEKIAKRLRRYKRRLHDHHVRVPAEEALPASQYILEAEPDHHTDDHAQHDAKAQPVVIAEMALLKIDQLTVGEAVMRMELADLPAMMFRNSAHGGLNMVYRRTDGNVGWVDPAGAAGQAGA